jgi:hypothetical protein
MAYDGVMQMAKVKSYIFGFNADNEKWLALIRGLGTLYKELETDDKDTVWFERKFQ